MKKVIFLMTLPGLFIYSLLAQETTPVLRLEASYVSDLVSNFSGGLDRATTYLGMIDLTATFNTENFGLWKNGEFYFQLENTHGGTPSADYVGDIQTLSNIENGDFTYLYQFWYNQRFNKLSLTLGVHDLNSEFLASDNAGEYINSSFGIMPIASWNVPVSIFPKISLGAIIRYDQSEKLSFQAGFYDGDPLDLDTDPYNLNLSMGNGQGMLSIFEINYLNKNLSGSYKLGAFHHNGNYLDLSDTNSILNTNYGTYFIADQYVGSFNENSDLNIFLKLGISPKDRSINSFFWCFGLNINGLIARRPDDVFGIAIANALISSDFVKLSNGTLENYESTTEVFYKLNISGNFTFQPEIQYIINPGAQTSLNNSFVGLLRTYITF